MTEKKYLKKFKHKQMENKTVKSGLFRNGLRNKKKIVPT